MQYIIYYHKNRRQLFELIVNLKMTPKNRSK